MVETACDCCDGEGGTARGAGSVAPRVLPQVRGCVAHGADGRHISGATCDGVHDRPVVRTRAEAAGACCAAAGRHRGWRRWRWLCAVWAHGQAEELLTLPRGELLLPRLPKGALAAPQAAMQGYHLDLVTSRPEVINVL